VQYIPSERRKQRIQLELRWTASAILFSTLNFLKERLDKIQEWNYILIDNGYHYQ